MKLNVAKKSKLSEICSDWQAEAYPTKRNQR